MADLAPTAARRVVVVDDHRFLVEMLVSSLADLGYEATSADVDDPQLAENVLQLEPDLVLLDAVFDDDEDGGLRLLRTMTDKAAPEVAMLTGVSDELRHAEFLESGAVAVISKADSFDTVLRQVEDVLSGFDPHGSRRRHELACRLQEHRAQLSMHTEVLGCLTDRELATLQALVDGLTVDQIAVMRTVAESTVRSQVRAVLRKLNVHSQIEAVALGARHGMEPSNRN